MGVADDVMQLSAHLQSTIQQQHQLDQQQQTHQQQQQSRYPHLPFSTIQLADVQMYPSVQLPPHCQTTGQQQQQQQHQQQDQQQQGRYPQLPYAQFSYLPPPAVVAPGGYTVVSPTSPPISPLELPTPFIDCQRHSCCTNSSSSNNNSKLCSLGQCDQLQQYNQLQQYGQQHPQQQYGQPVYPIAVCIGQPVEQQQQEEEGGQENKKGCCQCTLGWALYGLGWIFPLCWVAAIILPFLTKAEGDKRAAIASGVTLAVLAVVAVLVTVVVFAVSAATPDFK